VVILEVLLGKCVEEVALMFEVLSVAKTYWDCSFCVDSTVRLDVSVNVDFI